MQAMTGRQNGMPGINEAQMCLYTHQQGGWTARNGVALWFNALLVYP